MFLFSSAVCFHFSSSSLCSTFLLYFTHLCCAPPPAHRVQQNKAIDLFPFIVCENCECGPLIFNGASLLVFSNVRHVWRQINDAVVVDQGYIESLLAGSLYWDTESNELQYETYIKYSAIYEAYTEVL